MAILGIDLNRENPTFTKQQFCIYMPQFTKFFFSDTTTDPWVERTSNNFYWDEFYEIANKKIFYSIYGVDWKLGMSYCIAHYLTLLGQQITSPAGDSLGSIAGGGVTKGVLANASVGGFNKSYDLSRTMLSGEQNQEALFWNQTSYGSALMALIKTKGIPSILVVTQGPLSHR